MNFQFCLEKSNQSEDCYRISMPKGYLSKSSCSSLFGDRALWPHEILALGLISHVWKTELDKISNVHGWAGQMPEAKEQMMPAGNISGQSPSKIPFFSAYCKYTSWYNCHHINLWNTFYYSKHFYIYSLIWNFYLSCNIIKH